MGLLDIKDLHVHYGTAEALKGCSLELENGEVVTLIGTNGAGKTTTLRTISGLVAATSGEITFQGTRINRAEPHEIVKLGIAHIPEGRIVFSPMTVFENLKLGAYLRKDKDQIKKDLEIMHTHFPVLKSRMKQLAGSLSGGEQQMLAIARALMASPKLILMDEPSMGLSPLLIVEVGKIISNLNQGGMSILLVEQNARMALKLASRAYILEVGNIVLEGDAEALLEDESVKEAYLGG
jgi:branched-chain amino acid transport system ATP-binding protein